MLQAYQNLMQHLLRFPKAVQIEMVTVTREKTEGFKTPSLFLRTKKAPPLGEAFFT
jgi:hypothetical protein